MQKLLIKEAYLVIPFNDKKYPFLIKQASLEEILEFDYYLQLENEQIIKHILNLLKKINPNFKDNAFNKISPKNFSKIYKFFLNNYCTGFYEQKKDITQAGTKKSSEVVENTPFSSIIAGVITNSNETMETLLKLTWEQIVYLSEGIKYNANELTEEGKAENKKNNLKKDIKDGKYEDTLSRLRKNREKINAKFINNKK